MYYKQIKNNNLIYKLPLTWMFTKMLYKVVYFLFMIPNFKLINHTGIRGCQ